jgi:3-phenylpropionate/trans-cinnamate dioxygenase ferredoxin reductase component
MRVVIAGAGVAGRSAAVALRDGGHDGEVVLVGEEPHPPYDRPQLSKEYLRGAAALADVVRPMALRGEHAVDLRLGTAVERVLPEERAVALAGGERLSYDRLLIATGVRNRRLRVAGSHLDGIHDLRDLASCDRIRDAAASARRAVVVGMGFIGCEVAASLRHMGVDVTAVEPLTAPLARALDVRVGRVVEGIHRDHGVDVLLGEEVTGFEGSRRVERVLTRSGRRIDCDLVVVGIGVRPADEAVAGSSIQVDDGIVVDERCRTTVEDVFAAGDVARHRHPLSGRQVRVEHWQNAVRQGQTAARNMLGGAEVYDEVHWFWSDQYEHSIQHAGLPGPWDDLVVRGDLELRSFVAFHLLDGRIVSAVAIDRGRDLRRTIALIREGTAVDPAALRDPDVDLRRLTRPRTGTARPRAGAG